MWANYFSRVTATLHRLLRDASTLTWEGRSGAGTPDDHHLLAATCRQPEVKGLTMMTNSQYNGWRFEDVWLDK
jgi:hypothetical protein